MAKKRNPKSLKKFIRQEKARIRRELLDDRKQEGLIKDLYQKISSKKEEKEKNKTG